MAAFQIRRYISAHALRYPENRDGCFSCSLIMKTKLKEMTTNMNGKTSSLLSLG